MNRAQVGRSRMKEITLSIGGNAQRIVWYIYILICKFFNQIYLKFMRICVCVCVYYICFCSLETISN